MTDIDKSMSSQTEAEAFQQPRVTAKCKTAEDAKIANTQLNLSAPKYIGVEEDDPGITFVKIVSKVSDEKNKEPKSVGKRDCQEEVSPGAASKSNNSDPSIQERNPLYKDRKQILKIK